MKEFFLKKIAFRGRPWVWKVCLLLALLAGFGLRMINLTNPPLDFASTRQLFSILKARGMYYQYVSDVPAATRQLAISLGNVGIVEPPVLETIVSQTYRLTGEYIWIGRIYSALFWVLGGLALFLLIREFASISAAMIGTLFYLFVPFGVIASRAFMPDPLMVALIIYSLWALFRWQNTSKWKWAILFGIFAGAALFVKNLSVFIILGGFAGVVLGSRGIKRSIRDAQVWVMGVLMILPVGIYTIVRDLYAKPWNPSLPCAFSPICGWTPPSFSDGLSSLIRISVGRSLWLPLCPSFWLTQKRERPLSNWNVDRIPSFRNGVLILFFHP